MTSDCWIETNKILSKMVVKKMEVSECYFCSVEESEDLETVGPQGLLQARGDEAGGGGGSLNVGGAVAVAKNIFIAMSEKSRLLGG